MPDKRGSIKLFTFSRIGVYVHWSWLVVALLSFQFRTHSYSSLGWNALEYLSLFAIVLLHEFGHQLACRQVGGQTQDIVLWPLGGVAYVRPPERPGAQLWSIAAGPMVNVILVPLLAAIYSTSHHQGWDESHPDLFTYLQAVYYLNWGLLIFNLMPIYPLDGGQILRSLLWFPFGRANSLMAASIIGFVGVAGLLLLAFWAGSWWLGIMAVFILMNCWRGLNQARVLGRLARIPRRDGFACPSCHASPPLGPVWRCGGCGARFDTFQTSATCPVCAAQYPTAQCVDCGVSSPFSEWRKAPPIIDV